jgi:Autophagy receptor ATG43
MKSAYSKPLLLWLQAPPPITGQSENLILDPHFTSVNGSVLVRTLQFPWLHCRVLSSRRYRKNMASNPGIELASALQSASIKRHPSPSHDVNPSTAASAKAPATATVHSPSFSFESPTSSSDRIPSDIVDNASTRPRRSTFPPLPDLRFEQSYLASIRNADTWGRIAYITTRDQVLMPLVQGIGWNLALFGWRYWNRGAKLGGQSLGSRVRRWWWEVNNWELPKEAKRDFASEVEDVRHSRVRAL